MAPNSPSETAKANPAAASSDRQADREVDAEQHPERTGAERGRGLALPVVDGAEHRRDRAHHQRQRDHRLRDRDQPRRRCAGRAVAGRG